MKNIRKRFTPLFCTLFVLFAGLSILFLDSCSKTTNPASSSYINSQRTYDISSPEISAAIAIQDKYTDELMQDPNILAVGTGVTPNGKPAIMVFSKTEKSNLQSTPAHKIPSMLENIPVIVNFTDDIKAYTLNSRYSPVATGVSIGNYKECAAGTLGAVVSDGTNKYILSNNHVMARENSASTGEYILQPGRYDAVPQCTYYSNDIVANLTAYKTIDFSKKGTNVIDAAIAKFTKNRSYTASTLSSYYGYPSSTTATASVNMAVKKVGRTTELTTGSVYSVNTSVKVSYSSNQTATFTKQIVVNASGFSGAGDSGSLIVTNNTNKYPVGLLFAGSSTTTIINPIADVLSYFKTALNVSSFYICNSD